MQHVKMQRGGARETNDYFFWSFITPACTGVKKLLVLEPETS